MDVREVTVGAEVSAPRERVWQVVSDIAVMPRFSTELVSVQWADGFTYTAQIGPGPSGVTMLIERSPDRAQRIVERRLAQFREAMTATLTGIGHLAEKGSG